MDGFLLDFTRGRAPQSKCGTEYIRDQISSVCGRLEAILRTNSPSLTGLIGCSTNKEDGKKAAPLLLCSPVPPLMELLIGRRVIIGGEGDHN